MELERPGDAGDHGERPVAQRQLGVRERRAVREVPHRPRERDPRALGQVQGHGLGLPGRDRHHRGVRGVPVVGGAHGVGAGVGGEGLGAERRGQQRVALRLQVDRGAGVRNLGAAPGLGAHHVHADAAVVADRAEQPEPGLHVARDHGAGGEVRAHVPHAAVPARDARVGVEPGELRGPQRVGDVQDPDPFGVVGQVELVPAHPRVVDDRGRVGGDLVRDARRPALRGIDHPQRLAVVLVADVEPLSARIRPRAVGVVPVGIGEVADLEGIRRVGQVEHPLDAGVDARGVERGAAEHAVVDVVGRARDQRVGRPVGQLDRSLGVGQRQDAHPGRLPDRVAGAVAQQQRARGVHLHGVRAHEPGLIGGRQHRVLGIGHAHDLEALARAGVLGGDVDPAPIGLHLAPGRGRPRNERHPVGCDRIGDVVDRRSARDPEHCVLAAVGVDVGPAGGVGVGLRGRRARVLVHVGEHLDVAIGRQRDRAAGRDGQGQDRGRDHDAPGDGDPPGGQRSAGPRGRPGMRGTGHAHSGRSKRPTSIARPGPLW